MKKKLAWLLVVCMILQLSAVTVYAEGETNIPGTVTDESMSGEGETAADQGMQDENTADTGQEGNDSAEDAESGLGMEDENGLLQDSGTVEPEAVQNAEEGENKAEDGGIPENTDDSGPHVGNLSVELVCTLPVSGIVSRLGEMKVVLAQGGTEISGGSFTVQNEEEGKASAQIGNLPEGTYDLLVLGGRFAYSQSIDIQHANQQIRLVDMTAVIDTKTAHPGTYGYGDFNSDGFVDDADRALLLDAVSSGSEDAAYDLNGDSVVDLADLQWFTYSYEKEQVEASVLRTAVIDETKIEAKVADNSVLAEGNSVADVLTGNGSISVKPVTEEAIWKSVSI